MRRTLPAVAALTLLVAPAARGETAPAVRATVDEPAAAFGDPFRYTVEASAPAGPGLRVIADTAPFAAVGPPATSRSVSDGVETVRLVQTLACLDRGCLPVSGARTVRLPPARASSGGASATATPPSVVVRPRVPAAAVAERRAEYRRDTSVPSPSTRAPAGAAAVVLTVLSVLLVVLALTLVAVELGRRPRRRGDPAPGVLERALRLLRESVQRPAPDRRMAADYAARALAAKGAGSLADDATRLAWSPPDPGPGEVETLAERAEAAVGERV